MTEEVAEQRRALEPIPKAKLSKISRSPDHEPINGLNPIENDGYRHQRDQNSDQALKKHGYKLLGLFQAKREQKAGNQEKQHDSHVSEIFYDP